MQTSDLLIIGAGPGGYETAVRAAAKGLNVTLIERDELGGTCLNRGCIPTKTLCRSAEVADLMRQAEYFGVRGSFDGVDYAAVCRRKDQVVGALREGVASLLRPVNVVQGEGVFTAPDTVEVNGEKYTAPRIIVATGSRPASLPIPGAEHAIDSDRFLELKELPARVTVIGGGVVGMEFAHVLNSFGVEVTVIEACPEILPPFDKDIAKRLRMSLKRRGINFLTDARVREIAADRTVIVETKGKEKMVMGEMVLMAVGRRPVVPAGLEKFVALTPRGFVETDDEMRCRLLVPSEVDLRAIGDVNGRCMLAHAASAQGEVVLGEHRNLSVIPSAVFTSPECAMVGLTERECEGRDIRVVTSTFHSNGKAVAMGEPEGLVKKIYDAVTGKLLGCHIMGPHASDLIIEPTAQLSSCSPIHPHPTLSEVLG